MTGILFAQLASVLLTAQAVSIRVVDPVWVPIPGAAVQLTPVSDCVSMKPRGDASTSATGVGGSTELLVSGSGAYVIRAEHAGGFEAQDRCVQLGALGPSDRAYVHFRLRLDPAQTIEMGRRSTEVASPDAATVLDFVGTYEDATGKHYTLRAFGNGIQLGLPDGRELLLLNESA